VVVAASGLAGELEEVGGEKAGVLTVVLRFFLLVGSGKRRGGNWRRQWRI
jgi:hypothetical protein